VQSDLRYALLMMATEKVSVTIGREELRHAKRLASRLGMSLSGFITDALRRRIEDQARREAALEVRATFGPEDRPSPVEISTLLERWAAATLPLAERHSKSKAKRRLSSR
jgi:hypothetical protein